MPWQNHTVRPRPRQTPTVTGFGCHTGEAIVMATLTETSKGKTLELTPAERVKLAGKVKAALDRLGYSIAGAAKATTLSSATIRMRLRDRGEGPGTRIALWTWVALCDGLQLDPVELADSMGVEIDAADWTTARHALAVRRRRMGGEVGGAPAAVRPQPDPVPSDGVADSDLNRFLETIVERRISEAIDDVVRRKLGELSA